MLVTLEDIEILPQSAVIRENDCIGCTKCIQACPVDAIIGAAKFMHTVISDECIGCGLCLSPCPVNCIDLIDIPTPFADQTEEKQRKTQHARMRFQARHLRLSQNKEKKYIKHIVRISPDEIRASVARVIAKKKRQ